MYILFFSELCQLRIAVLNNMCINSSESNLQELCPNIEELDLSSNLFSTWLQVAEIARQLSYLKILNVRYVLFVCHLTSVPKADIFIFFNLFQ